MVINCIARLMNVSAIAPRGVLHWLHAAQLFSIRVKKKPVIYFFSEGFQEITHPKLPLESAASEAVASRRLDETGKRLEKSLRRWVDAFVFVHGGWGRLDQRCSSG